MTDGTKVVLALSGVAGVALVGYFFSRRRKRSGDMSGLEVTARVGPRTGVLEVDKGTIAKAASDLVATFETCGRDMVRPSLGPILSTTVRDADTGLGREVALMVIPSKNQTSMMGGAMARLEIGRSGRHDTVVLYPAEGVCASPDEWRRSMRRSLSHELVHTADPGLGKKIAEVYEKRRPAPALHRCENQHDPAEKVACCKYVNDESEVAAFVSEASDEVGAFDSTLQADRLRRKGVVNSPKDLLAFFSPTWRALEAMGCVRPKHRRRFLRMAALEWERRGYGASDE
jgi:hypothetical protein